MENQMPAGSSETVSFPFIPVTCPSQQPTGFLADPLTPFRLLLNLRVLLGFVFACVSQLNQTALNPLRVTHELRWLRYSDSVRVESPNLCHLASLSLQSVGNALI